MSRKLDLLMVHPGSRRQIYQSLGNTLAAVEPPVWAGLMATFIRNHGFAVDILDAEAEELDPEETAERIVEIAPRLTAIVVYGHQPSASTQNMTASGAICTALKRLDASQKVILVGGHVAALPQRTLREEDADFTCTGEGPFTL
ncbi:MAG: cobalamin-dependent protein, partial [Chloroflexota bacterium]